MDQERNELLTLSFPEGRRVRLDDYLAGQIGWLSRVALQTLIRKEECLVNGEPCHPGRKLRPGDTVTLRLERQVPTSMTPEPMDLPIVFEDEHLLVVNKPVGVLVHPTKGEKTGTLANGLAWYLNPALRDGRRPEVGEDVIRPGFPHRLDKETSGLLAVGKTRRALQGLAASFAGRSVRKRYLARTGGWGPEDSGEIEQPLKHFPRDLPHWQVHPQGKPATTRFAIRSRWLGGCLLELEPVTGRTNQLRVHCAWKGFPILGDIDHGGAAAARLHLHAWKLGLTHPVTGAELALEAEIPPGFEHPG